MDIDKLLDKRWIKCILIALAILVAYIPIYREYTQHLVVILLCIITEGINLLFFIFPEKMKSILDTVIKYRYLVALVIFVICVLFKVSGSSIGEYNNYLYEDGYSSEENILLGKTRSIRSDEYVVHTPYYMSQSYNNFYKTSYYMSLSGQDMILGYNAPVLDITVLAKPLTWGYILLGNEYGLSWYWCLKTILFILVSFELINILTKNKYLALVGSLLVVYSPCMQWWFVPHIADVFLWGISLLVSGYYFFVSRGWLKNLLTLLVPLCAVVFVLALFPSLQVPTGLIAVVLLIMLLIRDKDKITFKKIDIIRIVIMALLALGIIGYTLYDSRDGIMMLFNTVYPGSRVETGGNYGLTDLFTSITTIFFAYKDSNILNNCEASTFIHFGIISMIMYVMMYKRFKNNKETKVNMGIGNALFIILLIEIFYMIIGFPEWLAKITLFSYINRMNIVYGLTSVIFTVFMIGMIFKFSDKLSTKEQVFIISLNTVFNMLLINSTTLEYLPMYVYVIEIIVFDLILYFIMNKKKIYLYASIICLLIFSSLTINPITIGIDDLTDHELVNVVSNLDIEDDEYVLSTDNIVISSILLANGVKVINAVNFYPDFDKWYLIDETHEYEDYYNRYLHEIIILTDEDTKMELLQADCITLYLSIKDLYKWNIRYIVTPSDLDTLDTDGVIEYELIIQNSGYNVYEIEYL